MRGSASQRLWNRGEEAIKAVAVKGLIAGVMVVVLAGGLHLDPVAKAEGDPPAQVGL